MFAGMHRKAQENYSSVVNDRLIEEVKKYFYGRKIGQNINYRYPTRYQDFEKDLFSNNRNSGLAQCRTILAVVLRNHYGFSLSSIGDYLGGRDHSTIIHLLRNYEYQKTQAHYVGILRDLKIEL
jgi:chromosomal replication initiation ATPase DnaA